MTLLRNSLLAIFVGSQSACGIETKSDSKLGTSEPAASNSEVTGPMSRVVRGDGGVSDFYTFNDVLPDAPGVLLRHEPLNDTQSIPGAAKNFRLLYTSTDGIDGETHIPVSGSLFLPEGTPPEGGWPVIAWAHGTVGIADICAPTWTGYIPIHQTYLKTWLDQGYAIVASDYQGLGTKGTHPYLATKPASYSTMDAIRAVQNSDFPLSDDIVVIGQSQGAAAAFATAGHAPDYAPELNIKGVVATGIPYFTPRTIEIIQETRPNDVVDPMLGYNFLALTLVEQMDPDFKVSDYVSDEALPIAMAVEDTCHRDVRDMVTERELTYDTSFKVSPDEALKVAFAQMGYPRLDLPVPAYIGTAMDDRDTPLRMQANLIKQACAAGATIQSHIYPGLEHISVMLPSTEDSIPFVKAVFAGDPIPGNCNSLPFEK